MKERFKSLERHLQEVAAESSFLRIDLKEAILALPENPAIQRVGEAPKCYTISSKELFSRDNWTARFHDFKTQYYELCEFIDKIPLDGDVLAQLDKVLNDGYYLFGGARCKLHPEVVKNVAELLGIKLKEG